MLKKEKVISFITLVLFIMSYKIVFGQTLSQKLDTAIKGVMKSKQGMVANLSFYIADTNGNLIYEYNGSKGLSPASTQKIFTAAIALEELGKDYKYITSMAASGNLDENTLNGDLYLRSTGDPTLGSWRYEGYKPENFIKRVIEAIKSHGIHNVNGNLIIDDTFFDFQNLPGGWAWNDIGNYYGTGIWGVNWRENQFDVYTNGSTIKGFNIEMPEIYWINDLETGGTSDKSIIYTAPHSNIGYIQGKLPAKSMTISGAMPNPPKTLGEELMKHLKQQNININGKVLTISSEKAKGNDNVSFPEENIFFNYQSPTLEKMIYWFMRKSINLYGETFIKTIAKEKKNNSSFDKGMEYMKEFWKEKGINPYMINFIDGSGLSPQNYVSAKAEVQALLWAKQQKWYPIYYEAFPIQSNGMKMKSGTIKNTKAFAGYHKSYVFSIIINNYQGNAVDALYKILNVLK